MEAQRLGPASSIGAASPKPFGLGIRIGSQNLIHIKATRAVGPKLNVHVTVDGTGNS